MCIRGIHELCLHGNYVRCIYTSLYRSQDKQCFSDSRYQASLSIKNVNFHLYQKKKLKNQRHSSKKSKIIKQSNHFIKILTLFAQKSPQALQRDLGPDGPRRIIGVDFELTPQCVHLDKHTKNSKM